ncbi:uncharacterized protein BDV14DRAFT_132019 [Aspergillus stella-maris]|uniref:uncharacterized protein n=1 Tax=Aspergillus stella-maris TaxID=1810926 RepID=UPI003CCDA6D7
MPGKELSNPCVECKEADSVITIRRRALCGDCYVRFLGYKVFKRMEKYRLRRGLPRTGPCPVLLPLSYGLCSSVLLHMVHAQVEQLLAKPHAESFELQVLIVEPSSISPSIPSRNETIELLKVQFPQASFTQLPLHSVFEYAPGLDSILAQYAGQGFSDDATQSSKERLDAFRASITSATSIADVDSILLNRLIVGFAKSKGCLGIIWGDSDDRLAARTLANVSTGRGSSLTWQVSDGMSPFGLEFTFPLRDLFKAELQDYANLFPKLVKVITPDAPISDNVLTKNLSIDQLMMRYVSSQGAKYPGVMSNVTRTANKLEASRLPTDGSRCTLCTTFICNPEGASNISTADSEATNIFCYACERSRPELS